MSGDTGSRNPWYSEQIDWTIADELPHHCVIRWDAPIIEGIYRRTFGGLYCEACIEEMIAICIVMMEHDDVFFIGYRDSPDGVEANGSLIGYQARIANLECPSAGNAAIAGWIVTDYYLEKAQWLARMEGKRNTIVRSQRKRRNDAPRRRGATARRRSASPSKTNRM